MPKGNTDAEKDDGDGNSEISLHSTSCEVAKSDKGHGNGEDYGPLAAESVGEETEGIVETPAETSRAVTRAPAARLDSMRLALISGRTIMKAAA